MTGAAPGAPPETPGAGAAEYIAYQSIDTLLDLQHPRTDVPAEVTFYIMGQVKELLFKLLCHEVDRARDLLFDDRLPEAVRALHRTGRVQRVLESTWEALDTITPSEFNAFREQLGPASGAQSYMYRRLEFALGHKSPRAARPFRDLPGVGEQVMAALRSPSLWDAAVEQLRRHRVEGVEIPCEAADRDHAAPYVPCPQVERAWAAVYRAPADHPRLHGLGEALTEVAHRFAMWRAAHLVAVERILGNKTGTGGTSGVSWLRENAGHRFFPELWTARSLL